MVTVELTRGAAVGPFTAAQVVSTSPANAATTRITSTGEGAQRSFFLEATPTARFSGTLSISYTLSNAFGVSPVGLVTLSVVARPDPALDRNVRALGEAQVQAVRRFGRSQISNFMRRNEQLHNGRAGSSQNISVNVMDAARERKPQEMMAAADREVRNGAWRETAATFGKSEAKDEPEMSVPAPVAAENDKPSTIFDRVSVWVSGAIDIATRDASSLTPKLSATTSGLSGGVDLRLSDHTAIGVGGGYGNMLSEIGGKAVRLRAINSLVAAYGSTKILDGGYIDAVIGRGDLDFNMRRRVEGTQLTALGNRSGTMDLAALSLGVNKTVDDLDWSLYGRVEYIDTKLGGYVETGTGARYALRFAPTDDSLVSASLGFTAQRTMQTGIGTVTPRVRAELGREHGKAGIQYVEYADILGSNDRNIRMPKTERTYYKTSLGAMFELEDDWMIDLEYELMHSNAALSSGIKVQLSHAF